MKIVFVCAMFLIVQPLSHSNTVAPQKPKNISCKILDFIKMVCTWDPLRSSAGTRWSLQYGVHCRIKWSLKLNPNKESKVIWDKDSESAYRLYCKQCIQIIGTYKTGTIKSDVIRFTPFNIVELSPVNIIKVQMTNSSIYIEWKHTLIERPTVCYVIYALAHQPLHNNTKWNNSNDIRLTELLPSTTYNIRIKWKLITSIFWSEETDLNVTTKHAAPKSGPVITQGSYIRHKCLQSNQTCLTVYWKPIPGSLAETRFYEISNCADHENAHRNVERVGANRSSLKMKYPDVLIKSICIRENTDVGYSPYSTISLNQNEAAPPKAKTVTVKESKDHPQTLLVTWSDQPIDRSKAKVTNVTLLWCHGQYTFTDVLVVNCEDHIDWVTVEAIGSYRLRLTRAIDIRHFHVAVILNSEAGNRGMTWSECIFAQTGYINDLQLSFVSIPFSEKILVQWYPVGCKITVIPLMYQVSYTRHIEKHQQNPCESGRLVNVTISQLNVELKNLTSNEFYYICMRIITVIGPTPFSEPYIEKTKALPRTLGPMVQSVYISTTQRISLIIICLTSITVGLFVIIGFRYLWKHCYFPMEIDVPDIIKEEECPMNGEILIENPATKQKKEKWIPV